MDINMLAPVLAAVAAMIVGWAWYSEKAFGPLWRRLSGVAAGPSSGKGMWNMVICQLLIYLAEALALSFFLSAFEITEFWLFARVALIIWLAFIVAENAGSTLWERRPWSLHIMNVASSLVIMAVMTVIIFFV